MHSILAIFKLRYFHITNPNHGVSGKVDKVLISSIFHQNHMQRSLLIYDIAIYIVCLSLRRSGRAKETNHIYIVQITLCTVLQWVERQIPIKLPRRIFLQRLINYASNIYKPFKSSSQIYLICSSIRISHPLLSTKQLCLIV